MLRNLEGYKGSTRNFVAPVSESKFGGDFLQFTDTSGSNVRHSREYASSGLF